MRHAPTHWTLSRTPDRRVDELPVPLLRLVEALELAEHHRPGQHVLRVVGIELEEAVEIPEGPVPDFHSYKPDVDIGDVDTWTFPHGMMEVVNAMTQRTRLRGRVATGAKVTRVGVNPDKTVTIAYQQGGRSKGKGHNTDDGHQGADAIGRIEGCYGILLEAFLLCLPCAIGLDDPKSDKDLLNA